MWLWFQPDLFAIGPDAGHPQEHPRHQRRHTGNRPSWNFPARSVYAGRAGAGYRSALFGAIETAEQNPEDFQAAYGIHS